MEYLQNKQVTAIIFLKRAFKFMFFIIINYFLYIDARPVYLQKENSIKGHFLICYAAVLLLRIFQFKVLDNKYSTGEICEFIKTFRIVEINNNRYINITRSTPFIRDLAGILNQPITNYYLTARQIKMMLTR